VQTHWSDASDVVVTGTVTDANPSTTFVSVIAGGSVATAYANSVGGFSVSLHTDGTSAAAIQAHDSAGLNSNVVMDSSGMSGNQTTNYGTIGLTGVQIVQENGGWHIRGTVTGGSPGQTVITIVSTMPGNNGQTTVVENADGTFDIGINMTGGTGGDISITARDPMTGDISPTWEGSVN
jgi:hypothetical protein